MRFVLAMLCFVVAAGMMGAGAAQRTLFAGPSEVVAATTETTTTPFVVIDGAALNAHPETQNVEVSGADKIFAAYGRTGDVLAWVGDTSYTHITYDEESGALRSEVRTGTETEVPNPAGSDLWLREYVDQTSLSFSVAVPPDVSFLVASDGTAPAPSTVSVTWPVDNSTPWTGPVILAGAGLLLVGLLLLLWALTHMRKSRGPRRSQLKQPKMPKLPRQPRYKPTRPKEIAPPRGRRATNRFIALVPAAGVTVLLLVGCATPPMPEATPTPGSVEVLDARDDFEATAATKQQILRVIADTTAVLALADTELDAELAATRLSGPALEVRAANYTARAADSGITPVPPLPTGALKVALPGQNDNWPRWVFAAVQDDADETVSPVALIMVQETPRSQFKVHYIMALEPGVVLPPVAPVELGAAHVSPTSPLLQLAPGEVAEAYADVLIKEAESEFVDFFQEEGDTLRPQVGIAAREAERAALPNTAELIHAYGIGEAQVIALATNDSGAIVAVQLTETKTVKPVAAGAAVNPQGAVKAYTGKTMSTTGFEAVYGDQLLFYIPREGAERKVILLAFSQGLISAREL